MLNQLIGLCRRDLLKYRSVMFLLPLALILVVALAHLMSTLTADFFWGQERFVTVDESGHITSTFFSSAQLAIFLIVLIQCYYFTDVYFSVAKEKSDLFWRTLPIQPGLDLASKLIVPLIFMFFFIVMMALFDLYDFAIDKVIFAYCTTDCVVKQGHEAVDIVTYVAYFLNSLLDSSIFALILYFGLLPIFTFLLLLSSISKVHPASLIVIYLALTSVTGMLNVTEMLPDVMYIFFTYLDIILTQSLNMSIFDNGSNPLAWPFSGQLSASIAISTLFLSFAIALSRSSK